MAEIRCYRDKYIDVCLSTWHGFYIKLKSYLDQSVRGWVKIMPVRLGMTINKMLGEWKT
ncbi:hypothetical protein Marme_1393 [Marinomonas mediterranea MMB-1]|jgi:hypothetical protein|uniref:Uncharacterized protein n=1 Tax=Marinomonas mediterranea (strain ATCC 700492 / JCM 21426 / NBRC 103028 / MMB-1) TaxID=717774 RepID=F2JWJ2_MARM1|nr:hypothetical protein Marme_1393 [Marinomonas mediterranea MMB-1]